MKKWITCADLCSRWQINQYDLADKVLSGSMKPYHSDDFANVIVYDDRALIISPEGGQGTYEPISFVAREVTKFIFRISDIEKYEVKNGITPQKDPVGESSGKQSHDVLSGKKSIPKEQVGFLLNKAKKLRRDCPKIDQVMARKNLNTALEQKGFKPYSRTQFNRIVKDLNFPPARRGRKSTK